MESVVKIGECVSWEGTRRPVQELNHSTPEASNFLMGEEILAVSGVINSPLAKGGLIRECILVWVSKACKRRAKAIKLFPWNPVKWSCLLCKHKHKSSTWPVTGSERNEAK